MFNVNLFDGYFRKLAFVIAIGIHSISYAQHVEIDGSQLTELSQTKPMVSIIGHGSKNQFKISQLAKLHKDADRFVRKMNTLYPQGWVLVFGGDSANAAKPDIGYLTRHIHDKYKIPVLAIQSDIVRNEWGGVEKWIDFVHYVPTDKATEIVEGQTKEKVLWGGIHEGRLVGATKLMFGSRSPLLQSRFAGFGLQSVAVFGGGAIAEHEVGIARKLNLPILYFRQEAQNPEEGFPHGRIENALGSRAIKANSCAKLFSVQ